MSLYHLQEARSKPIINQLFDRLIIFWVMPPLGFLITVLQVPELRYLNANHVLIAVLVGALAVRWQMRPLSRWVALHLLLVAVLALAFVGIEWLHFLDGRPTIDGLTDVRMIIYSPFYGSVLIFVLYAMYLTMLEGEERQEHLRFFVRVMCGFHVLFLCYWSLLALGLVPAIPRADLLHSNSVAYGALFILCLMLLYPQAVDMGRAAYCLFFVVNLAVIFANQTRGAIIGLVIVAGYRFLRSGGQHRRAVLKGLAFVALLGMVGVVALAEGTLTTSILGRDVGALGIVLERIADTFENGVSSVGIEPGLVRDESSLSAFSRIGSNYYSLLSFLDNPLLGIGQAEAYSIKVLGSGVHSLHFLILNTTGIVGLIIFACLLVAIISAQNFIAISHRFFMTLFLFFGYVLVFNNDIPVYFSLIVTILASQRTT